MWAGFRKQSIECQLYFLILKSYQQGQGLAGRETQDLNIQQLGQRMQRSACVCVCLHVCICVCPRASICVRLRPSACVCMRQCACVCAQKIKRPDVSRRKKFLRPDASCSRTFRMYYIMYITQSLSESVPAPDGTSSSLRPATKLRVFLEKLAQHLRTILVNYSEGHACAGRVCS